MLKLPRTLALVAPLLLALPMTAQAAATPLNFEGLTTLNDGDSVESAYASLGVTIQGGTLEDSNDINVNTPVASTGAFSVFGNPQLTFLIDPSVAGAQFNQLSFMYVADGTLSMDIYARPSVGGASTVVSSQSWPNISGGFDWNSRSAFSVGVDSSGIASLLIDKVVFSVPSGPNAKGFALDNLSLSLVGNLPAPTGNAAPEPGTLALAGLAVVAAGSAMRRRRAAR